MYEKFSAKTSEKITKIRVKFEKKIGRAGLRQSRSSHRGTIGHDGRAHRRHKITLIQRRFRKSSRRDELLFEICVGSLWALQGRRFFRPL